MSDPTPIALQLNDQTDIEVCSFPSVSVIVPTFNCSQNLALTIDSLLQQNYPNLEILAIDAGSTDRTLEILHSYEAFITLSSVPTYRLYQMINQGILMAQGDYINIIFPGDFYIHHHTLLDMMQAARSHDCPEIVYCGTLLRDGRSELKFLFRSLTTDLLKRGQQPTSLQGCWFKRELFGEIGIFRTDFHMRAAFDLMCRFCLQSTGRCLPIKRAFVDYDLRWVTGPMVIQHFWETGQTLYRYFGLLTTLKWLYRQKDMRRFLKLWLRRIRIAFLGK